MGKVRHRNNKYGKDDHQARIARYPIPVTCFGLKIVSAHKSICLEIQELLAINQIYCLLPIQNSLQP